MVLPKMPPGNRVDRVFVETNISKIIPNEFDYDELMSILIKYSRLADIITIYSGIRDVAVGRQPYDSVADYNVRWRKFAIVLMPNSYSR